MKYSVAPLPDWGDVEGDDCIQIARHYRIPVEGTDILIVPDGRPGWLRCPASVDSLLDALDGTNISDITEWSGFADIADTVRALYDNGLLFIGGRTGLRAVPAPRNADKGDPPTALLLKLTGACDMACTYCYDYDAERWPGRMSAEIARRLIKECLQPGRRLMLMFHGGEPLLRFAQIRELVDYANSTAADIGASVNFTIQTNGLHFSETVVDFLRTHRFSVGVSLDGPREIHDRHRIDHGGKGTFERIAENFSLFPDFMRREVGYITVVGTDVDADQLQETWRFFRDLGALTWKLLPADAEGRAIGNPETVQFRRLFVEFLADRLQAVLGGELEQPYITNLVQLIEPFLSLERPNMCMKMPCGASSDLLVLDAVGSVRACDSSYHSSFQLLPRNSVMPPPGRAALPIVDTAPAVVGAAADRAGTVETRTAPGESLLSRSRASTSARVLRAREQWLLSEAPCASCPWLHQCAGTCPARAMINNGSMFSIDDLECSTRLALFPRILADVSLPGSRLRQYHDLAKQQAGAALAAAAAPPR
ncbi:radical SAM protein [Streptomyces sp. NBC_01558]|uniref:radical SAM protein n=1 Tax=Streptomyces sp. NBC_01558 TaxID=2975878 RepID=UPI002DDC22D7|nr:radical SAM protein [Streptomyces sp. NBC_01558]WSD74973.1 radical SAM protein [Streptomyces sp. NBC_01558]